MYSSNPRRVGIYNSYTWASIHMGSIYTNNREVGGGICKKGVQIVKLTNLHTPWMLIQWFRLKFPQFARRCWFAPDMFPSKVSIQTNRDSSGVLLTYYSLLIHVDQNFIDMQKSLSPLLLTTSVSCITRHHKKLISCQTDIATKQAWKNYLKLQEVIKMGFCRRE